MIEFLDPTTEARIIAALRGRRATMTVVMVAARPSTIALADSVVYVENGRVMAHAPHEDLLLVSPSYRNLVEAYERERAAS